MSAITSNQTSDIRRPMAEAQKLSPICRTPRKLAIARKYLHIIRPILNIFRGQECSTLAWWTKQVILSCTGRHLTKIDGDTPESSCSAHRINRHSRS